MTSAAPELRALLPAAAAPSATQPLASPSAVWSPLGDAEEDCGSFAADTLTCEEARPRQPQRPSGESAVAWVPFRVGIALTLAIVLTASARWLPLSPSPSQQGRQSEGVGAVPAAIDAEISLADAATSAAECHDTPGWTDGWKHCAYEESGTAADLCKPSGGAFWPSTEGWTCAAYAKKGWCSDGRVVPGAIPAGRQQPQLNCCACGGGTRRAPGGAAGQAQCAADTGGTCSFFGHCDASRGPSTCKDGKCLCKAGFCTDVAGRCREPAAPSTTPMADRAVRGALGLERMSASSVCQNTPGWTDGWVHCAYEHGGQQAELCKPIEGGSWPATQGWTCQAYEHQGWCLHGRPKNATLGPTRSYPEQNCCGCGGGKTIASPASDGTVAEALCEQDTGGTCAFSHTCASFRGAAECVSGKCLCQEGFCADSAGTCQPRPKTTPPPVVSAVRDALGIKVSASGMVCQDTPGWTDGCSLCGYDEDGGRRSDFCRPTPGAFWPSTQGWTCRAYEEKGWCRKGSSGHLGPTKNFPEKHCCACGGGATIEKGSAAIAAKNQTEEKPLCYRNTGGTCRLSGACGDFRGPARCVGGRCMCEEGYCTDATGTCRRDVGVVVARVAPVSRQDPVFPGRQAGLKTAVCISGGGSRSLSAAVGQLRALQSLGLMEKIDLVSSVSGGSWAASVYMFANVTPTKLLGPRAKLSELTLARLKESPAPLGVAATTNTNSIIVKLLTSGVPLQMLWVNTIAQAVLEPFHLGSLDAYMAADERAVAAIRDGNPQLRSRAFLTPQSDRPKAFVMGGTVEAPDGYRAASHNVVSLQMSPDFSGSPFFPNGSTVSYAPTPGTRRPPLRDILLGGGLVETFAFGGEEPAEGQSGGKAVRLQAPLTPLSLARAVAISSAAFGAAASQAGIAGITVGAKFDPQANLWPVTSPKHPGPRPAITYQLGDGSNLDNTGMIAALQRGVSKLVALINTDTPLSAGVDFCAAPLATDFSALASRQLTEKFGYGGDGDRFGFYGHNQVFAREELPPLLCKLGQLHAAGKPLVIHRRLRTLENSWWGVPGGDAVDVVFVLLQRSRDFEAQLPAETQAALQGGEGEFSRFPNYRTIFQNADLTALTASQANLLAAFGEFAVMQNAKLFKQLFQ